MTHSLTQLAWLALGRDVETAPGWAGEVSPSHEAPARAADIAHGCTHVWDGPWVVGPAAIFGSRSCSCCGALACQELS